MDREGANQGNFERIWFFFLFVYLLIEFIRIHDLLQIGFLRPGMLATIILAVFVLINGQFAFITKRQIRLIGFFVLLLIIYVPLARNNYYAFQIAKGMLIYVPLLLSIVALINTRERLLSLFWIFSLLLAYNAAYGILNGGRGPGSFVADENDLGLFLVTFLPFLFFLFGQTSKKNKIILFGIVALALIAVISTFSRGAFVGLLAMGFMYWWYSKNKVKIVFFATVLAVVFFVYSGEKYIQEMSTITDTSENTAVSRFLSWEAGWYMFLDNPLGVGGGNFGIRFDEYQPEEFRRSMWGRAAHSLWFTLIPETGVIGVLIYFSIIGYNLKDIFYLRNLKTEYSGDDEAAPFFFPLSTALLASLLGFFASATFLSVLYYPQFWILTAVITSARQIAVYQIEPPSITALNEVHA